MPMRHIDPLSLRSFLILPGQSHLENDLHGRFESKSGV